MICFPPPVFGLEGQGAWGGEEDLPPIRAVWDPYPVANGIAVDSTKGLVFVSDGNRKGVLVYGREGEGYRAPLRQILGPRTEVGFVAGIAADPERGEVYVVNNDIEDRLLVFGYDDNGNVRPRRVLYVPHQAWGVALNRKRGELMLTVQSDNMVVFYRQEASRLEAPLRVIRGEQTGLADPRGIAVDEEAGEIFVANHGNWRDVPPAFHGDEQASWEPVRGGRFHPPSIRVYGVGDQGDVAPRRVIEGERTGLNWPMGVAVGEEEVFVANAGDDSIRVFSTRAQGDVRPIRTIRGPRTGLARPVAVAVDRRNREVWVANFLDHTLLVFDERAEGDVPPKRVVRTAPEGVAALGFINPMAVAYDSRRDQILVPN